jgi:AcrR family transcriptional regulator
VNTVHYANTVNCGQVRDGGDAVTQVPTRRERLREGTAADIKRAARDLLVYGGPSAISLRAIARTLGMSAAALYRYFPSLEALIMDVAVDLYDELRSAVAAAAADDRDPTSQLVGMARAFRDWSRSHPAEFALIFGNPVPGVAELEEDCLSPDHPGAMLGAAFLEPFVALWHAGPAANRQAPDLGTSTAPLLGVHGENVPPGALAAFLAGWTRLYGLVAMEVFGHLRWAVTDVGPLFESELGAFLRELH